MRADAKTRTSALRVACPTCDAVVGAPCVPKNGAIDRRAPLHIWRVRAATRAGFFPTSSAAEDSSAASKPRGCTSCGGLCDADCVDNFGSPYKGCRRCRILSKDEIASIEVAGVNRGSERSSERKERAAEVRGFVLGLSLMDAWCHFGAREVSDVFASAGITLQEMQSSGCTEEDCRRFGSHLAGEAEVSNESLKASRRVPPQGVPCSQCGSVLWRRRRRCNECDALVCGACITVSAADHGGPLCARCADRGRIRG